MAWVSELALMATCPMTGLSEDEIESTLVAMAHDAFTCLGDTKIVEDMFNVLRDHEMRDTRTKVLKLQKQMHTAYLSRVISDHIH